MHKRSVMVLAVVATLAVAGALWMNAGQRAVTETQTDVSLVPDLLERVNEIDRVEIRSADHTVTLLKGDSGWTVSEKGGYPANMRNLRKQLIAIAQASIIEPKTANPDNYSRIGVGDVASGSDSVSIKLGGLSTAVDLLVGKQNYRGQASTYVRRAGEAQSYLVSGSLKMDSKASAWLLKDIFNVGSPRVRRVVLEQADGSTLEIVKSTETDPNFEVLSIPEGRELASPSAGNAVAGALGSLRLEDVEPASDVEADEIEVVKGIFETFDGLRITTRAWKLEDKHFLALTVAYDESLVPEPEADAETEASAENEKTAEVDSITTADAEEATEQAVAAGAVAEQAVTEEAVTEEAVAEEAVAEQAVAEQAVAEQAVAEQAVAEQAVAEEAVAEEAVAEEAVAEQAVAEQAVADAVDRLLEAAEMQSTVAGWVYVIPSYKYSNMTKTVYDLLKPLPIEQPDSDE